MLGFFFGFRGSFLFCGFLLGLLFFGFDCFCFFSNWRGLSRCENRIFYVSGLTHGTVSVGGSLYCTELAGDRKKIVPANIENGEEVFREFRIAGGTLYYKIARFDENRQDKQYTLRTLDIGPSAAQLK